MINEVTKSRLVALQRRYQELSTTQPDAAAEIARAEIPEAVYNSNAIENSTLTLAETEDILLGGEAPAGHAMREIHEATNLAKATEHLIAHPKLPLTRELILELHRMLLHNIRDEWAGRYRRGKEWVRVGGHVGAHPDFVEDVMAELLRGYHEPSSEFFLERIAWFHAEFETIHPFLDGNGRIGRVLINQQLLALDYPPLIIPAKNKEKEYYPVFRRYPTTNDYGKLTELLARQLTESLNKRITLLSGTRPIPLAQWARQHDLSPAATTNKAKRGTLPAFRQRGRWMIAADATPSA